MQKAHPSTKIVFDEGRKNWNIPAYVGQRGNAVPPLAISKSVLDTLVEKTEKTIRAVYKNYNQIRRYVKNYIFLGFKICTLAELN